MTEKSHISTQRRHERTFYEDDQRKNEKEGDEKGKHGLRRTKGWMRRVLR